MIVILTKTDDWSILTKKNTIPFYFESLLFFVIIYELNVKWNEFLS